MNQWSLEHKIVALSCWLCPVTLGVLIFLISHRQVPEAIPTFQFSDKMGHLMIYTLLSMLAARAVFQYPGWVTGRSGLWVGVVVSIYGVSDEFHQWFIPTRKASIGDLVFDMLGAILGTILYLLWHKFIGRSAAKD